MSLKLIRLDAAIKIETNRSRLGCLKAERAGFLGRQGHFDTARQGLEQLQREFAAHPDMHVSIWMHIAEGWIAHYSDNPSAAHNHLQRAYALSTAVNIKNLRSLSAAWLAHLAYSKNDFAVMGKYLRLALDSQDISFHPAESRICMLFAMSLHYARRLDSARPWYIKCREHALAEGDDGTVSALNFNMAGLQANHTIQASVFGEDINKYAPLAATGSAAAENFDLLVKNFSRKSWVYIIQAYTLSSCENFKAALDLYNLHLEDACSQGLEHQRAFFVADMSWCLCNLGDFNLAQKNANEAIGLINEEMYTEDRAVALGRLAQVFNILKNKILIEKYKTLAEKDWKIHEKSIEYLYSIISKLLNQ